uniref:Uncharacterized protein n=1 Tax=Anguilla anguilla TaxID=7936 RepID=A0A0E9U8F7_ANGAN
MKLCGCTHYFSHFDLITISGPALFGCTISGEDTSTHVHISFYRAR